MSRPSTTTEPESLPQDPSEAGSLMLLSLLVGLLVVADDAE